MLKGQEGIVWLNQTIERPILAGSITALSAPFESALPIAESFDIQRTRTSSYDATIKLPTNSAAVELRVKPETPATPARYRISLAVIAADESTTKIGETNALLPSKDGFVSVYLNPSKLSPAVYEVAISGDADTSTANSASSFLIELTSGDEQPSR